MTWGKLGKEIANKLEGTTDEESIKALAGAVIVNINKIVVFEKRENALKTLNREILKKFPRQLSKTECYYHDPSGRADLPKWRHLIFKYLTLGKAEKATKQLTEQAPEQPSMQVTEQAPEQPTKQAPEQSTKQAPEQSTKQAPEQSTKQAPEQPTKQTLKSMTIDQLELDGESLKTLEQALQQSGMTLPDFIQQAVRVYSKTITGKNKNQEQNLSAVSSEKLLNDPTYSTHPKRAEELTKRAIRAIALYNANVATENADRWMITQSAIASLTGSRQSAIKEIMPKYQTTIDDNNKRPEWQLNPYSNRKPGKKIEEIINLSELVRDGLG